MCKVTEIDGRAYLIWVLALKGGIFLEDIIVGGRGVGRESKGEKLGILCPC